MEQLVQKTHFSRRAGFEHEALPLADHPHDLEALDHRRSRGQGLESTRRINQPLQCAVIRLQPVVEIFNLPVLNAPIQRASALEGADRLAVSLVLAGVDRLRQAILTEPQRLAEEATR